MGHPTIFTSEQELPPGTRVVRGKESALKELYTVRNPKGKGTSAHAEAQERFAAESSIATVYVYYPWRTLAVETVPEAEYFELRTARNRNLITAEEQKAFRNQVVGIAGLSVGSAALEMLVATGGPKTFKLADPDIIETTNLNRIRAGLPDLCQLKTETAARRAYELDPFVSIERFDAGITQENLARILEEPRLDLFIDEMDNIAMKIEVRRACRERRIPVLMATDNGDSAIVDVERFDREPEREIFHGRAKLPEDLTKLRPADFIHLSSEIIDPALFVDEQRESVLLVGSELAGVPQLATAASIAGAAVAYAARRVLTGADLPSGRYVLGCNEALTPGYTSAASAQARAEGVRRFADEMERRVRESASRA